MDLKPFEQLASWGGESYSIPRFQHLGRLLQCLNPNVTKNFGSISSLNHHLGWPTRCKIASNLLSLTWCQETCLTPHLPHPSTVPCDCYGLVNVDTFTSLLFGWKFLKWMGVMLEIVRETSLPQQKILAGPYITQSQKQRVYPLKAMVLIGRRALATFLLHETNTSATRQVFGEIFSDAPRLRRPKQKTNDYGTPNKDVGSWKILVFRCDIFLVQKLVPISRNRGGFWVLGKEFPFLLGGSYPTSSTNDPTVREKNVLVVTWDISSQYNPTNHLSNRSVGGNLGNPTGAVNKKKPLAEPVC